MEYTIYTVLQGEELAQRDQREEVDSFYSLDVKPSKETSTVMENKLNYYYPELRGNHY